MKLLYRADGGHPIGTGHLFRAKRILAELGSLCNLDASLAFASNDSAHRIASQTDAQTIVLPPRTDLTAIKPAFNAQPILEILSKEGFALVVVDMLDTTEADMWALTTAGIPIVTFDDRGPGRVFADAIVNILIEEPSPGSLDPRIRLCEGPEFAVLDPVFAASNGAYQDVLPLRRVFVTLGGGDAAGLSIKVAHALRLVPGLEEVQFALGPAYPHREQLELAISGAPWRAGLLEMLPSLLESYLWCDLAIVAGGLTMYEACCVGVPAMAVCQPIDHQLELAARLSEAGAMATVGYGLEAFEREIAGAVSDLAPVDVRARFSARGPKLVDGRGTRRVAQLLVDVARLTS